MDIMYLPNPTLNKNYKYLLTCIDVKSRYAFGKPLKNKTGEEVFNAILDLFKLYGKPKNLNIDEGKEFIYSNFIQYCEKNDITLWYSNPQQTNKNSIIERFHRTLRNLLLAYTLNYRKSYIDDIDLLYKNYNTTYHSTIKEIPLEIWKGKAKNKQKINLIPMKFEVGDKVRHIVKKSVFDKSSSTSNYTKSVYTIQSIDKNAIYLDDLKKPFRQNELVLAVENNVNVNEDYDKLVEKEVKENRIQRRLNKEFN